MIDRIAMIDMELAQSISRSPTGTDSRARIAELREELSKVHESVRRNHVLAMMHPDPRGGGPFHNPSPSPQSGFDMAGRKVWWLQRDEIEAEILALNARGTLIEGRGRQTYDRSRADQAVATVADREGFAIVVDSGTTFHRGGAIDITPLVLDLLRADL